MRFSRGPCLAPSNQRVRPGHRHRHRHRALEKCIGQLTALSPHNKAPIETPLTQWGALLPRLNPPAQGWNCYWVRTYTNIKLASFQVNDDNIKSSKWGEKKNGKKKIKRGTSKDACAPPQKIWAQSAGHRTPSLLLIYLLPAAHTLKRGFYLHFHPPLPPPHLFFWTCFLEKKDDWWYFDTYFSLCYFEGVVRVSLFLAPRCSLIWGIFFEVGESGGSLTREDFLGDQTSWHRHNFLSRRSRSGRAQSTRFTPALLL